MDKLTSCSTVEIFLDALIMCLEEDLQWTTLLSPFPPKMKKSMDSTVKPTPIYPHCKKILLHLCTKNIPISMYHSTDYCFAVFKPGVAVTAAYTVLSGMSGLF